MTSKVDDAKCHNTSEGAITINVSGGHPPYSFLWTTGATSSNLSDLRSGLYSVVVTDSTGCTLQQNFTVEAPLPLEINVDVTDVNCFGNKNGRVEINVSGGVAPYEYGFGTGSSVIHGGNIYERLHPGTYRIVVSDANGCGESTMIAISQPEKLEISTLMTPISCKDVRDGMIEVFAEGGHAPYTYTFGKNVSDSSTFSGLGAGEYNVIVTDANGCVSEEANVVVPESKIPCLRIPNVFTPNGDGVNDEWIIENIELFPEAHIYVFNRWGQLLYHGRGDGERWDGSYRGHYVPSGVYTYLIDLESVEEVYQGTVTVLY
jgi:gliding motility-associated-like protein